MLSQQTNIFPPSSGLIPPDPLGQGLTAIFSHPWQWIYKDVTSDGWKTERYPIKPGALWKLWRDTTTFVGVRFGKLSHYGLIDIDINSPYHPNQDATAIPGIICALESIGIYRVLILQSSDSGGIHLYIPLDAAISTYGLASALKFCCEDSGFNLAPGKLEIFPNCKTYRVDGCTNYNGHRLPLQTGSYLLNSDYQPISNDLGFFLNAWELAASGNDHHELEEAIERCKARPGTYAKTGRGEKWRQDCEEAIAQGWTDHGQTNELIGTLAQYGRVFLALAGEELAEWMVATAINAPGYTQWCRHQNEIHRRCKDWAKEAEGYYFPYPTILPRSRSPWGKSDANDEKASAAVERIKFAFEAVRKFAFKTVSDLAHSITAIAKCSLATLYKYRPLWHPQSIDESNEECNSQNHYIEADTGTTEGSAQEMHKTLEPLPDGLLHTRCSKKVLIPVTDFSPDQTSPKTHSQPPYTAPGFDFRDRGEPFKLNPCENVSQNPFPVWDSDDSG
jgi:hypothetical protein